MIVTNRFEILVNDLGDIVRVIIVREGKRVDAFTVQYEAMIDKELRPTIRYDTAHGFAHRDMLNWEGETIYWVQTRNVEYATALKEAIDDLTTNWERYRTELLRR